MPEPIIGKLIFVSVPVAIIVSYTVIAIGVFRIARELRRWRLGNPPRIEGDMRKLTRRVGIVAAGVVFMAAAQALQLTLNLF